MRTTRSVSMTPFVVSTPGHLARGDIQAEEPDTFADVDADALEHERVRENVAGRVDVPVPGREASSEADAVRHLRVSLLRLSAPDPLDVEAERTLHLDSPSAPTATCSSSNAGMK